MDLEQYISDQRDWSTKTFGDGTKTLGITAHIEKELAEIRSAPRDVYEWIDVVILALDGAWRAGYSPAEIVDALEDKQRINFARKWQPADAADPDKPSEHVRDTSECWATFTGEGGYQGEREAALGVLVPGRRYRVVGGKMGRISTDIVLERTRGSWNSVMFDIEGTLPFTYEDSYTTGR